MKSVVRVIDGSSLINKKISEIESEYGIKVLAKFNPYSSKLNSKPVTPEDIVYPDLCLEIEGNYDSMRKFSLATVDF